MTRKEAIKFYLELRDSGKLGDYATKGWDNMNPKEKEFYDFDDGQIFFNRSVGVIDYYDDPFCKKPKMNDDLFESLLGLESTRIFSDFTEEERRGLGIDD